MSSSVGTLGRTRRLNDREARTSSVPRARCIELLRNQSLFAGLSDVQLASAFLLCRQVHVRQGQILLREDEEITDIFVVLQGEVTVEVKPFHDFHLRPQAAAFEKVGSGGVIGCCALIESRMKMCVCCTQDTDLIAIDAGELRRLLATHPDMGLIVMANAFKMATERLACIQQQLAAQFGLSEMYRTYRNY